MEWLQLFERTRGRPPSKEEISAEDKRLNEQSVREACESFKAIGLPQPAAAADVFVEWVEAFMRNNNRPPSEAEFDGWSAAWRSLHPTSPSRQTTKAQPLNLPMVVTYGTGSPQETISQCKFHDRVANHGDVQLIRGLHPGECTFCALGFENTQVPTRQQLQERIDNLP